MLKGSEEEAASQVRVSERKKNNSAYKGKRHEMRLEK